MNQYLKYTLTVAVTAAAMVAYQYERKPEQAGLAQQAPTQVTEIKNDIAQVEQAIKQKSQEELEANTEKLVDSLNTFGRIQYRTDASASKEDAARRALYERINIEPYNPVSYSQCYVSPEDEERDDGSVTCEETTLYPKHHYYSATSEELTQLAYNDPLAAKILSDRIEDVDLALSFRLRMHAAAISGKAGPIADAAFAIARQLDPESQPTDGYYQFIALMDLAKQMGYPPANHDYTSEILSLEPEKLKAMTLDMARRLAETQITVTGSSSLKELFDV